MTASEIVLTVTLLAILWYSWETRKLRILSKRQIELAQEHTELSLKPHLEIVFQRAHFRLYNIGNGPAIHVRIDDKIVSPARYPERLRFTCLDIIRKDECLPIEVKILTEDGKHVDEMARLGFLTPPEATETIEISVHFENLIGKEYAYMVKIGKDMSIDSTPVDFLLQYLYEKFPTGIRPREIRELYVKPEDLPRHLLYCFEKGLAQADRIVKQEVILCDMGKIDGMIERKWTEKSSKIPMIIAGQSPVGYAPTGRRHAPNESNRRDQATSTTRTGAPGDRRPAQPQPEDRGQVHEGRGL